MEFALFNTKLPVPKIEPDGEHRVYQNTLNQAIVADEVGFHSFWTVEHHFLKHMSHCSNPEVLYGAVAARTKNIRIGYGIRLMPRPFNHPVRTAESVAVLDLISSGRAEFGIGRSSTQPELQGFGVDPRETQAMAWEALEHVLDCWTNEESEFTGKYWSLPKRRVQPKPFQKPHPPLWAAAAAEDSHRTYGRNGMGVLSLAFGGADDVVKRMAAYREGLTQCQSFIGKVPNPRAGCFVMTHCAPTREEAIAEARESFEWYFNYAKGLATAMAAWMKTFEDGSGKAAGSYVQGAADTAGGARSRLSAVIEEKGDFDTMLAKGGVICGSPDDVLEQCTRYAEAGVDLLMCLANPYAIPPDKVERSLRLIGQHVIPKLKKYPSKTAGCLKSTAVPSPTVPATK